MVDEVRLKIGSEARHFVEVQNVTLYGCKRCVGLAVQSNPEDLGSQTGQVTGEMAPNETGEACDKTFHRC